MKNKKTKQKIQLVLVRGIALLIVALLVLSVLLAAFGMNA